MGIIQENEIYISNDRLCFLFSLLINNGAEISCSNQHVADNFIYNFNVFVSEIMETYVKTRPQYEQEQIIRELNNNNTDNIPSQYNDWYEITYSDKNKVLIITLKDNGRLLNETLRRYTCCHWGDELSAWDNTNHFCSIKLCKDFYDKIENYNCKDFSTTDIDNIQAIILGYYKDCIKVLSIECNLDLSSIDDMLFIPFYEEYPTDNITCFVCKLDAREFKKIFNETNKEHSQIEISNKKKKKKTSCRNASKEKYHMQPKQWKLFFCLLKVAQETTRGQEVAKISKEHLIMNRVLLDSTGAQDTAKTRFNEKYNNIKDNKKGEYEDLIYPKVSDTRYYEFNVSKLQNMYNIIKNNKYLLEEYQKHKSFFNQIVDYDLPK